MWWSAVDAGDRLDFYHNGTNVGSFGRSDIDALDRFDSGLLRESERRLPELGRALRLRQLLRRHVDTIVFTNGGSTGFESDNHTIRSVPEPSALLIGGVASIIGLAERLAPPQPESLTSNRRARPSDKILSPCRYQHAQLGYPLESGPQVERTMRRAPRTEIPRRLSAFMVAWLASGHSGRELKESPEHCQPRPFSHPPPGRRGRAGCSSPCTRGGRDRAGPPSSPTSSRYDRADSRSAITTLPRSRKSSPR